MEKIHSYKDNNWNVYFLKTLNSTMDEIKKDFYKTNLNTNTLIMAFLQKNGRGRKTNKWISDLGNLFISIKLNSLNVKNNYLINYITGIIMYDVIKLYFQKTDHLLLKWPNDILVNKKKIAGILIETISKGNKISDIYIGIGINLKFCPKAVKYKTTSFFKEGIFNIKRKEVIDKIIILFNYWEDQIKKNDNDFIIKNWIKRGWPIGTILSVKQKNNFIKATYQGIDKDGSLRLLINNKIQNFFDIEAIEL